MAIAADASQVVIIKGANQHWRFEKKVGSESNLDEQVAGRTIRALKTPDRSEGGLRESVDRKRRA
jgi:hypothetical protein